VGGLARSPGLATSPPIDLRVLTMIRYHAHLWGLLLWGTTRCSTSSAGLVSSVLNLEGLQVEGLKRQHEHYSCRLTTNE